MKEVSAIELKDVIRSKELVLVDLFTNWCSPCRILTPILENIQQEYGEKIEVVKCDLEGHPEVAQEYEVKNIPTILYFKNGTLIDRTIGVLSKNSLVEKINSL